jgi:homoserine dehydrogenase
MHAQNHPGVLAKIAKAFGKANINIVEIMQRGQIDAPIVPVVVMCGPTDERDLKQALREIESTKLLDSMPLVMRVETSMSAARAQTTTNSAA